MSNPRLSIAQLKQIIQLDAGKLTPRDIGRALNLSHGVVGKYRSAARAAGLSWEEAQALRGREAVRRLRRAHRADLRRDVRGGVSRHHFCRRLGRERLRLCGSDAHRIAAGLARQSCADADILWRSADDFGARLMLTNQLRAESDWPAYYCRGSAI